MQQQITNFLETQDATSAYNIKPSPEDYHSNGDKKFARTQKDFLRTIFATETDLGFTPPKNHSGNRITFFVRFSILRITDSTSKIVPQILFPLTWVADRIGNS